MAILNGTRIHKAISIMVIRIPSVVPKKSLKIAPVYPIITEISSCKSISMRARSTGLRALIMIMAFSMGYSENWNSRKSTSPSKSNEKYNQIMIATPIPFDLSLVNIELKNASATNTIETTHPAKTIVAPVLSGEYIKTGMPAPSINETTMAAESPMNKLL